MTDRDEDKGFKIEDRRRFDAAGKDRTGAADAPRGDAARAPAEPTGSSAAQQYASSRPDLPAIDFSTFLLSLSTSAMVHLGQAPHPDGSTDEPDLELARQSIDILDLMHTKTKGNLTNDEQQLLQELLYDLRLRYVAARR